MDNNEFVMPFERAFKRLRVDGDELPTESIKNSSFKFSNDKSVIKSSTNLNGLTKGFTNMSNVSSCTASSAATMWRTMDSNNRKRNDKSLETQNSFDKNNSIVDRTVASNLEEISDKSRSKDNETSFNHQFKSIDINDLERNLIGSNELKKRTDLKSTSTTELAVQNNYAINCSHQARNESDITVDELAGYLDLQLYLPKKMSFMAELAYS